MNNALKQSYEAGQHAFKLGLACDPESSDTIYRLMCSDNNLDKIRINQAWIKGFIDAKWENIRKMA